MAEKLVIIGSGPAGWTCALYAARANLEPLVYEGMLSGHEIPGGQLMATTEVENFPGFPNGIQGPELMLQMREQALRFGARVVTEHIVKADLSKRPFVMQDSNSEVCQAQALVISTGASANYLGIPSEEKYKNHGVSACAVCDGALQRFRNKPLVVVGGGDSASEEGNYLSKFATTVHLVHRRETLNRASKVMAGRILSNPKVKPHWYSVVDEVLGEIATTPLGDKVPNMTGVRLKNVQTGKTQTIEAAGMFVAIGHTPNTKFLNGQLALDDKGFIKLLEPFRTITSVEGVFAAGDVADPIYKQAITAAGMGCKAALDAERWLASKGVH
ncbi:MAG TPA: thioredoxin-disulfide reductase [Tepidisphaeraceae bacterium]|jgi:thioredoxin reductase (NADPH)|nr:thioredoxin-disulfide reductase [Tepidisphaeraceae bacterium]